MLITLIPEKNTGDETTSEIVGQIQDMAEKKKQNQGTWTLEIERRNQLPPDDNLYEEMGDKVNVAKIRTQIRILLKKILFTVLFLRVSGNDNFWIWQNALDRVSLF